MRLDPLNKDFSGFTKNPRLLWNHVTVTVLLLFVPFLVNLSGMSVNSTRTGKGAKFQHLMAESRENVENAVVGDIIGVYDTGNPTSW